MKNFQKDFDRLLNNLKEAKDILRECNFEMQKALGETKAIKYVIYNPFFDNYVRFYGDKMVLCKFERADIFEDQHIPFDLLEKCGCNTEDFVVREISIKAVELWK